jgi:hypothetical protein
VYRGFRSACQSASVHVESTCCCCSPLTMTLGVPVVYRLQPYFQLMRVFSFRSARGQWRGDAGLGAAMHHSTGIADWRTEIVMFPGHAQEPSSTQRGAHCTHPGC